MPETKAAASQPGKAAPAAPPAAPETIIFRFEALQNTWLKKSTAQAIGLAADQRKPIPAGTTIGVVKTVEQSADAHELVTLAAQSGEWFVFAPHFRRVQTIKAPAPLVITREVIDWSDFDCRITRNFTVGEVLNFDHRRRPAKNSADIARLLGTAEVVQQIRNKLGRPLGSTSWYRPEPINREVGGVRNSFHVNGLAIDVYAPGWSIDQLYHWMRPRWSGGFGDGRDKGFLHLDRRNGGAFVPCGGVRPAAEWLY